MKCFVRPKDRTLDKPHTQLRTATFPWGEACLFGTWIRSCCRKLGHRWRERTWGPVLAFWSCVPVQERPPEPRAIVHSARRYPNLKISRERWRSEFLKCSA